MNEVNLKIRKRAMSSKGRARLHSNVLAELGIKEGTSIDLVNPGTNASVTVASYGDTHVESGYIRVAPEDMDAVGLSEEETVIVRVTPPLTDKAKAVAKETAEQISKDVDKARQTVKDVVYTVVKTADETGKKVSREVEKASGTVAGKAEDLKKDLLDRRKNRDL